MPVLAVSAYLGERARVHDPITHNKVRLTVPQAVHADEHGIKMSRVGWLMKADKEPHRYLIDTLQMNANKANRIAISDR